MVSDTFKAALDLARSKGKAPEFLRELAKARIDARGMCADEHCLLSALTEVPIMKWTDEIAELSEWLCLTDVANEEQKRRFFAALELAKRKEQVDGT